MNALPNQGERQLLPIERDLVVRRELDATSSGCQDTRSIEEIEQQVVHALGLVVDIHGDVYRPREPKATRPQFH